jgi:hypothetical protein
MQQGVPDDAEVLASVSAMPFRDADGSTIRYILSYRRRSRLLCRHTVSPRP